MRWNRLHQVKEWTGLRGKADYVNFLNGEKLSQTTARHTGFVNWLCARISNDGKEMCNDE